MSKIDSESALDEREGALAADVTEPLDEQSEKGLGAFSSPALESDNVQVESRGGRQIAPNPALEKTASGRSQLRQKILALALLGGIGAGGYYGYEYWTVGRFLISTDDAFVRADTSVIASKVTGYVTDVPVKDNVTVKAGDTLAQIDDRDYKNAVAAARNKAATQDATVARLKEQGLAQGAVIEQAKAQVASAKANLVRAEADFARAQSLAAQDFGSRKTLDQARADTDQGRAMVLSAEAAQLSAEANLKVLNAQVFEAESVRTELQTSLEKAELDLSFTTVKAPFGGIIGNKAVQPGQYVQSGTRLLALVPLDSVYVEANYKETQLEHIRAGQDADVTVDAAGGRSFKGVVESLAPASGSQFSLLPPENATGNFTKIVQRFPVRIRMSGDAVREGRLRPGLSVVTYIHTKPDPAADRASAAALDNGGQRP